MTDRLPLAQHTKASLDQLYDDLDRARTEARHYAESESADAAAGSYSLRAEGVEEQLARLRTRVQSAADEARGSMRDWLIDALADAADPREPSTAQTFREQAARAEARLARVTDLYEQWVKAGPPPLGVSMSRWWDARLVELREAIHEPADNQPKEQQP